MAAAALLRAEKAHGEVDPSEDNRTVHGRSEANTIISDPTLDSALVPPRKKERSRSGQRRIRSSSYERKRGGETGPNPSSNENPPSKSAGGVDEVNTMVE